jgi:hypothetical protein
MKGCECVRTELVYVSGGGNAWACAGGGVVYTIRYGLYPAATSVSVGVSPFESNQPLSDVRLWSTSALVAPCAKFADTTRSSMDPHSLFWNVGCAGCEISLPGEVEGVN